MGRDFDGVDDEIDWGDDSAFDGTTAFSCSFWAQQDFQAAAGFDRLFNKAGSGIAGWMMQQQSTNDFLQGLIDADALENNISVGNISGTSYSHCFMRWDNVVNTAGVTLDNETEVTSASTGNMQTNTASVLFGQNLDLGASFYKGFGAETAMWNIRLSDSEKLALFNGVNPFVIQHDNLQLYTPMYGNDSPEGNFGLKNTFTGTVTGTTKVKHPPVELIENYL